MPKIANWQGMKDLSARLLLERTGAGTEAWNQRIQAAHFPDEASLRAWLAQQGVNGYAQSLLVWEHFGYPDFMQASADDLIDAQYADRPQLRPILDALLAAAAGLGEVTIQARKTYISLVSPRRTFARVQATTRSRLDLGLRLEGVQPGGRVRPSKIQETTPLQISLSAPEEVDGEVLAWLQKAYAQNS